MFLLSERLFVCIAVVVLGVLLLVTKETCQPTRKRATCTESAVGARLDTLQITLDYNGDTRVYSLPRGGRLGDFLYLLSNKQSLPVVDMKETKRLKHGERFLLRNGKLLCHDKRVN